jgi:hypothetical protein
MQKTLKIQDFLLNKNLQNLIDEHAVYASPSKDFTKISLNYCQITARDSDELAQECRGLILRLKNHQPFPNNNGKIDLNFIIGETEIVALPFTRFFNYGQGAAANINFEDCVAYEKLDGTLTICYFDKLKNEWHIATRSVPEADIPLNFPDYTFRTLFEKALFDTAKLTFEEFTNYLDTNRVYCFELVSPFNQVVVKYDYCKLFILMVRDLRSLQECSLDSFYEECSLIPQPKSYYLNKIGDIINFVNEQNPSENEGVVVCDGNFNRIKIKNAGYVALSKIIDRVGHSYRNCLSLVLSDKVDDVLPFMPEKIREILLNMKENFIKLNERNNHIFRNAMYEINLLKKKSEIINERKVFAQIISADKNVWLSPLFEMYDNKVNNINEYVKSKQIDGEWHDSFLDRILCQIDFKVENEE